jgi:hypothetical protein
VVAEGADFLHHAVVALQTDALRDAGDAVESAREAVPEWLATKWESARLKTGTVTYLDGGRV